MTTATASRARSLALTVLLVVSAVGGSVAFASAQPEMATIDTDHALTTDAALQRYSDEGVASARFDQFDMRVTVADKATTVGLSEWRHASSTNTYLRIEYHEQIERTVRFYLPAAYFQPRIKENLEPVAIRNGSSTTLDLEPARSEQYTAVTLTVDGPTDIVVPVSAVTGSIFGIRGSVGDLINRSTGWEPPTLGSGGPEWQYVPKRALRGQNVTHPISVNGTNADDLTIQYDNDPEPGDENTRWLPVPDCTDFTPDAGVCLIYKEGQPQTAFLLSTSTEAPPVRYTHNADVSTGGESIIDQVASLPGRILSDLSGLWPGYIAVNGGEW